MKHAAHRERLCGCLNLEDRDKDAGQYAVQGPKASIEDFTIALSMLPHWPLDGYQHIRQAGADYESLALSLQGKSEAFSIGAVESRKHGTSAGRVVSL